MDNSPILACHDVQLVVDGRHWWWFLGISATSLLLIGILAYFSRIKGRLIVATINIALIPIVWWYGSRYSYDVPFGWFYDLMDAIQAFFS